MIHQDFIHVEKGRYWIHCNEPFANIENSLEWCEYNDSLIKMNSNNYKLRPTMPLCVMSLLLQLTFFCSWEDTWYNHGNHKNFP